MRVCVCVCVCVFVRPCVLHTAFMCSCSYFTYNVITSILNAFVDIVQYTPYVDPELLFPLGGPIRVIKPSQAKGHVSRLVRADKSDVIAS